ncbi:MAG: ribonuclease catalytic domain-containing protein [Syntrophobacteraceae bacterium]
MSRQDAHEIAPGAVLEFYESKEILCGVVLAVKDSRFNVLTERNREVNVTLSRIIHCGKSLLNLKVGRDELLKRLAEVSETRRRLMEQIELEEVWSLLESEETAFSAGEIAEYIFSSPVSDDQSAAVHHLLLQDRLYFQAKDSTFFPRSRENVETRRIEMEREAERERRITEGANWAAAVSNKKPHPPAIGFRDELIEELKNFAVFGLEAKEAVFIKEVLKTAGIPPHPQSAFRILVRLGIWREDENLMLYEHGISPEFSTAASGQADEISSGGLNGLLQKREDLTGLEVFTVDNLLTRDYDDALSIRELADGRFEVGIHIADAAEMVPPGTTLDREAETRVSSIYLPDERISMLPPSLSEGILSLKAGKDRLALSFLLTVDSEANICETRIVRSTIRVRSQRTYEEVNARIEAEPGIRALYELANKFRQKRIERGAIILPLPEIQVYVNSVGMIQVSRYDKETPSQILVSEWMIAANAAAADYLVERGMPAVFRNQAECRPETEFTQSEHELFKVFRQRRLFSRAELGTEAKPHCSLAIPHYTTVTSPIRRYSDLIVQRQLKHAMSTASALYTTEQLGELITKISVAQARIFMIQRKWTRYWILKFMEQEDLETLTALVLDKNARFAHLLIPDYLLETNAPVPQNSKIRQGDQVKIHIEKLNPREDLIKVQIQEIPSRAVNSEQ